MKAKKVIAEIICLILALNFFYEGVYKLVYLHNYGFWLYHAPLLKPIALILTYIIPVGEIVLSWLFVLPRYRTVALYSAIAASVLFILYIMSGYLFTNRVFWPYHALWNKPSWMQKMIVALGISWLAFIGILLSGGEFSIRKYLSTSLRNTPAPS
jgi:hypothetical protein